MGKWVLLQLTKSGHVLGVRRWEPSGRGGVVGNARDGDIVGIVRSDRLIVVAVVVHIVVSCSWYFVIADAQAADLTQG